VAGIARRVSIGHAAVRTAIGTVAVTRPSLAVRPWVGTAAATSLPSRVLGRAAGARDLALGAGALLAVGRDDITALRRWTAAGAVCEAVQAITILGTWRELPRSGRMLVVGSAAMAAALGALAFRG
jgi:stage V sporulation protein SpoVS